jgi:serine O-acetyltransferase
MPSNTKALKSVSTGDFHLEFSDVVDQLRHSREVTHNIRQGGRARELPSPQIIMEIIEALCVALFPTHLTPISFNGQNIDLLVNNSLNTGLNRLVEQVRRGLQFGADSLEPKAAKPKAYAIVQEFSKLLPAIRAAIVEDLRFALKSDPAAGSIAEILLSYRGATAIIYHRLAHALHGLGARLVPRMISDLAHAATGIEIHPGATIGEGFFIEHGTGVVIGETAVIGRHVRIHQGVTLGARSNPDDGEAEMPEGQLRHPVIGDNVVIYAGATILGPVTIGKDSIIGGNLWITQNVAPASTLTQRAASRAG